jgi:hypothetical protein
MTNPYGDSGWPGQEPPRRGVSGSGVAMGVFLLPVPVIALMVGAGWLAGAVASVVVLGVAIVAAFLMVVAQDDPFRRGLGVGLLITLAVVLLLFGACFAILTQGLG